MIQRLTLLTPCLLLCLAGIIVAGAQSSDKFMCYSCANILQYNSSCVLGEMTETEECSKYCFVDVSTAAGLIIHITRGCSEDECSVTHSCKQKSRTGKCKSCCSGHLCNGEYPDIGNKANYNGYDLHSYTAIMMSCLLAVWVNNRSYNIS